MSMSGLIDLLSSMREFPARIDRAHSDLIAFNHGTLPQESPLYVTVDHGAAGTVLHEVTRWVWSAEAGAYQPELRCVDDAVTSYPETFVYQAGNAITFHPARPILTTS